MSTVKSKRSAGKYSHTMNSGKLTVHTFTEDELHTGRDSVISELSSMANPLNNFGRNVSSGSKQLIKKMSYVITDITPKKAEEILTYCNTRNRRPYMGGLARMVVDMEKGNWRVDNGDVIRFNTSGELLDGQHRLMAIQVSGATTTLMMVFNIDDTVRQTIDTGKPRAAHDALTLAGWDKKTAGYMARGIEYIICMEKNHHPLNMRNQSFSTIIDYAEKYNEDFWEDLVQKSKKWFSGKDSQNGNSRDNSFNRITTIPIIMGLYYHISNLDANFNADDFFDMIFFKAPNTNNNPFIEQFHNAFYKFNKSHTASNTSESRARRPFYTLFAKAYNYTRMNEKKNKVRISKNDGTILLSCFR
jgi:hypothetical protein